MCSKFPSKCCFNYDNSRLMQGSEDGTVYVYDIVTAEKVSVLTELKEQRRYISSISCHERENTFLASSFAGTITIWTEKHV